MRIIVAILGIALLLVVLWDAFETVILPRRVTRKLRLTRLFYRSTWRPWRAVARALPSAKRRESFLSFFGPLSLLFLLGVWAAGLIVGFALLHWSMGSLEITSGGTANFATDLYLSGTTFFTLGLGDVVPRGTMARLLTVTEGGMGFGFLAVVIGYLPVLYQAFSRREVNISLLDARAGSPPTAGELLRRHSHAQGLEALTVLLRDLERWCAELLESHLSYPSVAYFRSQHINQSWLSALTTVLDTCSLVMAGIEGACERQAELTFAMARHVTVDLAQVFNTPPRSRAKDRLPPAKLARLRATLAAAGLQLREGEAVGQRLAELRHMYEPYLESLGDFLYLTLPPWMPESKRPDNWQVSAWERSADIVRVGEASDWDREHF